MHMQYVCVYAQLQVYMYVQAHMWSQRSAAGVFFDRSPPYFLRQNLSLSAELTNSAMAAGQWAPRWVLCPHLPSTGLHPLAWLFICCVLGNRHSGPPRRQAVPEQADSLTLHRLLLTAHSRSVIHENAAVDIWGLQDKTHSGGGGQEE